MGKLNRLSARAVATKTKRGYYADGGGLYLQVSKAGTKSWVFRYTRGEKTRDMGLGSVADVGLAEAREAAAKCRNLRREGKDPIDERKAELAALSGIPLFRNATKVYIADQRPGWTNDKHAAQWEATLENHVFPIMGDKRVDAVTTQDALAVLRPIWTAIPETATRVRQRCEAVLDAETVKGHRKGDNPFRWRGHLSKLLPKPDTVKRVQHFPALPYRELPDFMAKLDTMEGTAARALEFTILTIGRTEMTISAKPGEFEPGLWKVPGDRMKSRREHWVPIVSAVQAIIDKQPKGEYLFSGAYKPHLSNGAMLQVLERMGYGHVTVHGFRSTFKDWASETTHYANEVSEAALAHVIKDKAEAAYRRGQLLEKRRPLMQDWANYCLGA